MRATRRPSDRGGDLRRWMNQSSSHSTICSRRLRSNLMTDLGPYGTMAARHMARWQPSAYAAIPAADRDRYFRELDEQVADAIQNRERSLKPPSSLQESDFLAYVGQMNMAHLMAEEAVLAEMVYLPPEPGLESEADEPMTDETGAFIDPGWRSPRMQVMVSDEDWEKQQGLRMFWEDDVEYQREREAERRAEGKAEDKQD
jgi:hypothetical protein